MREEIYPYKGTVIPIAVNDDRIITTYKINHISIGAANMPKEDEFQSYHDGEALKQTVDRFLRGQATIEDITAAAQAAMPGVVAENSTRKEEFHKVYSIAREIARDTEYMTMSPDINMLDQLPAYIESIEAQIAELKKIKV